MSDDEEKIDGRGLRLIWRTVTTAAIVIAAALGAIVTGVSWAVRHDARLENVEKWQSNKDREASRELWRRMPGPPAAAPQSVPRT